MSADNSYQNKNTAPAFQATKTDTSIVSIFFSVQASQLGKCIEENSLYCDGDIDIKYSFTLCFPFLKTFKVRVFLCRNCSVVLKSECSFAGIEPTTFRFLEELGPCTGFKLQLSRYTARTEMVEKCHRRRWHMLTTAN